MRNTILILFAVCALAGCGGPAAPNSDTATAPTTTAADPVPGTSTPSSTTTPNPSTTSTSTTTVAPTVPTAGSVGFDDPLVAFEARWLCEVQRHSFPDLGAMEELRLELLAEEGISADEYAGLQDSLAQDPDRRSAVLAAFQAVCSG